MHLYNIFVIYIFKLFSIEENEKKLFLTAVMINNILTGIDAKNDFNFHIV